MKVAVLGGTGRTGQLLLTELTRRGHHITALARDPGKLADLPGVTVIAGNSRDHIAVQQTLAGTDAVLSALGPVKGDHTLHRDTAVTLLDAMAQTGVTRFIGISGAGMDVPGDQKSIRDKIVSKLMQTLGGKLVADKPAEYRIFADSTVDWTLVRPPRLLNGPATGRIEHHAHQSAKTTSITRADLATFLADCLEQRLYVRQAPLVAAAR